MSRSRKQKDKAMSVWTGQSAEGRHFSAAIGNDFSQGRRGMAKAVRGAKKYIRSRVRFHDKADLRKEINND
jgi:hypothetical protein